MFFCTMPALLSASLTVSDGHYNLTPFKMGGVSVACRFDG